MNKRLTDHGCLPTGPFDAAEFDQFYPILAYKQEKAPEKKQRGMFHSFKRLMSKSAKDDTIKNVCEHWFHISLLW